MSSVIELTKALIARPSITPDDAGCQALISERLKALSFHIEPMRFGEVDNLWARHGTQSPLFVFAGHTDVVPTGPVDLWRTNPFQPIEHDGYLYGRGAADMKSGLAAMIVSAENFIRKNPHYKGSIGFLITSDEEGPSINGTQKVVEQLMQRGEKIDYCIIGEASSEKMVGDQIRIGRRGSLGGKVVIHGKQGHVAFPHLAKNPIHEAAKALDELTSTSWDQGNISFPPTTFQISNLHAGTGALNIIPSTLEILFNFRFGTASTIDTLRTRFSDILMKHRLDFDLHLNPSAYPFLSQQGKLLSVTENVIKELMGFTTQLSTGGGTSDGRFIITTGAEVIELGPCNTTVHQVNECVRLTDLEILTQLYQKIIEKLFLA